MSRDYLSETEMLMSFVKQVENLWANVAKMCRYNNNNNDRLTAFDPGQPG